MESASSAQKRPLGNSDLKITPLGVGTWAIGGNEWGPQDDGASVAAIEAAIGHGINWVDTAPIYGLGHAEEVVGRALRQIGSARRPYVFTKCSFVWDERGNVSHVLDPASIRREVEASLRRLGTEIDLMQIHHPSMPPGGPAAGIDEAWDELSRLRQAGKVRWIGVSNFEVAHMQRIARIAPITSLQPPYSMLTRDLESGALGYCEQHAIGVIVYSPMHSGLLSGSMTRERVAALSSSDWRKTQAPAFQEPFLSRNLELVEHLKAIGARHGRSAGEVAIAWTLRHHGVTGAIAGARSPAQVEGFMGAMDFRLSPEEVEDIARRLPASVPLMVEE
jgi:aryl-alcohol dehydrogenase-like predicted oxidoreductase